ncbi:hypothetical protein ACWCQ0_42260 [Streptomyces massasporeus]|uniref:hypothetical protein n=1 Tax=Streptomyces massasporeus TaxID=67324 RepID=UPI0033CBF4B0
MVAVEGAGVGVAGGVVSCVGGWPAGGVLGVTGVDRDGVGVGESGWSGVHGLSPPFHAAMRWYGVTMLPGS